MGKDVFKDKQATELLKSGVNKAGDVVGSSMGPDGKTVIISNHSSIDPIVTKDGVTIASCLDLKDKQENIGAKIVRLAALKTLKDAGDGTTQTVVLAQALINNGLEAIEAGANPQELKLEIEKGVADIVENIKTMAVSINSDSPKIKQVATIASNNDEVIGQLISDAYVKIGNDGLLLIEKSGTIETSIEVVEGVEIPRGFVTPEFINDRATQQCIFKDPLFLVTDYTVKTMKEFLPILQDMQANNLLSRGLVVVAEDYEGEAYSTMVINQKEKKLMCCLTKAPGTYRREHLEDIATITGATIIRDADGLKMESARVGHLGSARNVFISQDKMSIVGGGGTKEEVDDLKNAVKVQMEEMKDEALKAVWEKRLARISCATAIIKVGGATDVEVKEREARVDDACRAVKSAIAEGVVPGGGVALLRSASFRKDLTGIASKILADVCMAPIKKMLSNSGNSEDDIEFIVNKVQKAEGSNGFNLKTGNYEDLMETGVVDPAKVIRCALQNAASVAGAVIGSDYLLIDEL